MIKINSTNQNGIIKLKIKRNKKFMKIKNMKNN